MKKLLNMKVTMMAIIVGTVLKDAEMRLEESEIRGKIENIQTIAFVTIDLKTQKSSGDLRKLSVTRTQVKATNQNACRKIG